MSLGLVTDSGRTLVAQLMLGAPLDGITHCALGDGDDRFIDPKNPPPPMVTQTALAHELVRKKYYKRAFLHVVSEGRLVADGIHYAETPTPTNIIGVFFQFDEQEARNLTLREYGYFGGNVAYREGIESPLARDGVHHPTTNPSGEVATPGYLYEIKHIPDLNMIGQLELIGIIKI